MNIFSIHAGRTDFLKPHVEYLRHYCKDNFTYHCVDNFVSPNEYLRNQCLELGVEYVRPSFTRQGNAFDHGLCLNLLKEYTTDDVINVIYEFDIFLVDNFSFIDFIEEYNISGIYQQRNGYDIEYIAPFIVIVNKDSDFSSIDFIGKPGCDVGGKTEEYIKSGKTIKWMKHTPGIGDGLDKKIFLGEYNSDYGCQVIENSFIHYYKGTNWNQCHQDFVNKKTKWFFELLEKSKSEKIFDQKYLNRYQTIFSHAFRHWNGSKIPFKSTLNPYYEN